MMCGYRMWMLGLWLGVLGGCGAPRLENGSPLAASCSSAEECGRGEFCELAPGQCGGVGLCRPRGGGVCTEEYAPVCGCDGRTYGNRCQAAAAGVSVLRTGTCDGVCRGDVDCLPEQYCRRPDGQCGGEGSCQPKGVYVCTREYAPVCGCDGRTYGNRCAAMNAGVSVLHTGTCDGVCQDNAECPEGDFCQRPDGQCTGTGSCKPVGVYLCSQELAPVCGCDGRTYRNRCEAQNAGVSVAALGACN